MDWTKTAKLSPQGSPNDQPSAPKRRRRASADQAALRLEIARGRGAASIFEQIRTRIREAIADGTLSPGVHLPPERTLAARLGVSRTSVAHAYQELVADGLVSSARSRGTVVAAQPAKAVDRSWVFGLPPMVSAGSDVGLLREVVAAGMRSGVVSFASSAPPDDLIPVNDIADCARAAFDELGPGALRYGPVDGSPELRRILADRMRSNGALDERDTVMIVSGSTQGLALAARVFTEAGDDVVVEAPTYVGTIQTFEMHGARLIGVPVDGDGMRTDLLEGILVRRAVRLIVVQTSFQNPTGACLGEKRREHLLWLAHRYGVPIIEDDAYGALYYDPPPSGTLKQVDRHGLVTYMSTFSKTLAPGLRVGWMCGPEPVVARLMLAKQFSDLNTNSIGQAIVERMISSGRYDTNLDALRRASKQRMRLLVDQLQSIADVLEVDIEPRGGLHVWCRILAADAHAAAQAAADLGVAILAGTAFFPSGSRGNLGRDRIRVSLPVAGKGAIRVGGSRLKQALTHLPHRSQALISGPTAVVV